MIKNSTCDTLSTVSGFSRLGCCLLGLGRSFWLFLFRFLLIFIIILAKLLQNSKHPKLCVQKAPRERFDVKRHSIHSVSCSEILSCLAFLRLKRQRSKQIKTRLTVCFALPPTTHKTEAHFSRWLQSWWSIHWLLVLLLLLQSTKWNRLVPPDRM